MKSVFFFGQVMFFFYNYTSAYTSGYVTGCFSLSVAFSQFHYPLAVIYAEIRQISSNN